LKRAATGVAIFDVGTLFDAADPGATGVSRPTRGWAVTSAVPLGWHMTSKSAERLSNSRLRRAEGTPSAWRGGSGANRIASRSGARWLWTAGIE